MQPRLFNGLLVGLFLASGLPACDATEPLPPPPDPKPTPSFQPRMVDASAYVQTATGLRYFDFRVGEGAVPKPGQTVEVHYTGWLDDGTLIGTSRGGGPLPLKIGVGLVIQGWDEGLLTMRQGGERQLIIPPPLGYGSAGFDDTIPPNAVLVYEVDLLNIRVAAID